jgi:phosphoribosyl 1,2-cyclic phosphodiesterase
MKLKVINSNSKGNCYLLGNNEETLMLECGVKFPQIQKALDFDLTKVVGCIVTHEHKDHCVAINEVMNKGIDVYASSGTLSSIGSNHHRQRFIKKLEKQKIGGFTILPFDVKHDAVEPFGYLIHHKECGNVLFLTDTYYSPYKFKNLNNIIIEANYSEEIMDSKAGYGNLNTFVRNRVVESHLSIETCKKLLLANDLTKVNNIVLIHLSDANSDEIQFQKEIEAMTLKTVTVACPNLEIDFNINPF